MGLTFFLALFLISTCFADDAKNAGTDKKDQPAADSRSTPDSESAAANSAASPAEPDPAAKPANPAPPPQRSRPEDSSEQVPKYVPMPALDGNPGLFTLETGDTLPAGAVDLSIGVNKFSRMPGNITVLQTVPAFGMGFNRWFSVFLSDRRRRAYSCGPALAVEFERCDARLPAIPKYDLPVNSSGNRHRAGLRGGFSVCVPQWWRRGRTGPGFQDRFALGKTREALQPLASQRLLYSYLVRD